MLPDPLVGVEIGSVARQLLQFEPPASSAREKILDRPSPMYRRAVPYDKQFAGDLAHQVLQKAHRVFSLEGALLLGHVELASEGDGAHSREVISREILLYNGRLAHRSR